MVQAAGADLKVDSYSVRALADWNHDGVTDLIVGENDRRAGQGPRVLEYRHGRGTGPGDAILRAGQWRRSDRSRQRLPGRIPRVFDWNGDGQQDLVLGLADGTVLVALNEHTAAEPRFAAPDPCRLESRGRRTSTLAIGLRSRFVDWNNDGRKDVVLGALDGKVRVLLNVADSGALDSGHPGDPRRCHGPEPHPADVRRWRSST